MTKSLSSEEILARISRSPKLAQSVLALLLEGRDAIEAQVTEILTSDDMPQLKTSPIGATLGNREAFPDFDRVLLVTLRRMEMLLDLVSLSPPEIQDSVFQVVYFRGFSLLAQHLALLSFGPLHAEVEKRIDDPAYVRAMTVSGPGALAARAELFRMIRKYVTSPGGAKLMEKSAENTAPRVGQSMGILEVS